MNQSMYIYIYIYTPCCIKMPFLYPHLPLDPSFGVAKAAPSSPSTWVNKANTAVPWRRKICHFWWDPKSDKPRWWHWNIGLTTVDGCEILHQLIDGKHPTIYRVSNILLVVQDFATINSRNHELRYCVFFFGKKRHFHSVKIRLILAFPGMIFSK